LARPLTLPPAVSATAQLEQRLGTTQLELRKLGSERHTLRARLRREADRLQELESALRAEKELRRQASEAHSSALNGLRSRAADAEAEKDRELARLATELEQSHTQAAQSQAELEQSRARASQSLTELMQARAQLDDVRAELEQARAHEQVRPSDPAGASSAQLRAAKVVQGLRRIRGIGPAYQRVLEQLGVTRVQQIAKWSQADVLAFAEKLKIRPDRIAKDDWVGQASGLEPDAEE
jgi:predicted flap endonuclease-1-like 5' DNA nuclease